MKIDVDEDGSKNPADKSVKKTADTPANDSQKDFSKDTDEKSKKTTLNIKITETDDNKNDSSSDFTQFDSSDNRHKDSKVNKEPKEQKENTVSKSTAEPVSVKVKETAKTSEHEPTSKLSRQKIKKPEIISTITTNQPNTSAKVRSRKNPIAKLPKPTFSTQILRGIGAIVIVALVAVGVVFVINKAKGEPIDDSYFVTDDTKVSINMEPTKVDRNSLNSANSLSQTHIVYEYDGDKVTGLKTYFEYSNHETAKKAYESLKNQPEFEGATVQDRFIIVTAKPESFQGLTASDVKQQEEAIRQFQASQKQNSDQSSNEEQQDEGKDE